MASRTACGRCNQRRNVTRTTPGRSDPSLGVVLKQNNTIIIKEYLKLAGILVDDEDLRLITCVPVVNSRGYVMLNGKHLHLLILTKVAGMEVDHIDGNKLDCRKQNLRLVPHHINSLNRKASKTGKLPRGVYVCGSGRFVATIMWKGKRSHLGTFDTPEQASTCYEEEFTKRIKTEYGQIKLTNRDNARGSARVED